MAFDARIVLLTKNAQPLDVLSLVLDHTAGHDELCTRIRRRFRTARASNAAADDATVAAIDRWACSSEERAKHYLLTVERALVPWPLSPPPYTAWRPVNVRCGDTLTTQRVLCYDTERFDFAGPLRRLFEVPDGEPFEHLHRTPEALLMNKHGSGRVVSGRSLYNRRWKRSEHPGPALREREAFLAVYKRFLAEVVAPSMLADLEADVARRGSDAASARRTMQRLIFQRLPTMRVQLAGADKALGPMHTDAGYGHQASEINFWVPLTATHSNAKNTLWSESSPGRGDFAPFRVGYGQAVRFWGNRCRHYTVANEDAEGSTRISFDLRAVADCDFNPVPYGDPALATDDASPPLRAPKPSELALSQFNLGGFYDELPVQSGR